MGCVVDCSDLVTRVSGLLNDQAPNRQFVRWSKADVQCAYDEAVRAISLIRPDLTIKTYDLELQEGTEQKAPDGCNVLSQIIGQVNEDGKVEKKASQANSNLSKYFSTCSTGSDTNEYVLGSFELDKKDKSTFYVDPPVKKGQEAKVRVQCIGVCESPEIDCRYEPVIIEYMMYRLLGTEEDSASSAGLSAQHYTAFMNMLSINYIATSVIKEEAANVNATQQSQA